MEQIRKQPKDKNTKQVENIYEILTNKRRHLPLPLGQQDLQPHLIIQLKVPQKEYIGKNRILRLVNLITSPSYELVEAYTRAQNDIAKEMVQQGQNDDPNIIKIRLQTALENLEAISKKAEVQSKTQQKQQIDLKCLYSYRPKLDIFTIQVNLLIYKLQHVCGFRVRKFILLDQSTKQKHLYLFLSLSNANLMRVANDYQIKKEIDYVLIDFFLNDPCSSDKRPLKYNSEFISKGDFKIKQKQVNRYFKSDSAFRGDSIIQEKDLNDEQINAYQIFDQEYQKIFTEIRQQKQPITDKQRDYLFEFNRGKVNHGSQQFYLKLKKQRKLYQQAKKLAQTHKYTVYEYPQFFQEFFLLNKNMKGANFFNKLQALLLYKPSVITKQGKMSLFCNMQKATLCYILLKKNLQITYLKKIGGNIFTLSNDFQKFGEPGQVRGGLDGKHLTQSWPIHSLGCDIKTIRSYVGTLAAFQILFQNYLLKYFFLVGIIQVPIFIIESIFDKQFWFFTCLASLIVYTVSFNLFIFIWFKAQERYISNYTDGVSTKLFLQSFRGPYFRNLVTDQPNQFFQNKGVVPLILNVLVWVLMGALLVVVGAIFHGILIFILQIYGPMQKLVVFDYISLPHIIGYTLFFKIQQILRKVLAKRVINLMVLLKSPPSDDQERLIKDRLSFYYVVGIQLIPSAFFLIIYPFTMTQCYSDSCRSAMLFYIYSRSIIVIVFSLFRFIVLFIIDYFRSKMLEAVKLLIVQSETGFSQKLSNFFQKVKTQSKKPEHQQQKLTELSSLTVFAIYSMLLPIIPSFMLVVVMIKYIVNRMEILYQERRPLPCSRSILPFLQQLTYIFYIGVLINSWMFFFSYHFIERYGEWYINIFAPNITEDNLFTLKLITGAVLCVIMNLLGVITTSIAKAITSFSIQDRQKNKFQQYMGLNGIMKISLVEPEQQKPIMSIFRTYNPNKKTYRRVIEEVQQQNWAVQNTSRQEIDGQDVFVPNSATSQMHLARDI